MEYRIICNNWKYRIQYRKWFWFWTNLKIVSEDMSFGGLVTFYSFTEPKDFETYQGALQYLRRFLGHDVEIKEARFIV